MDHQTMKQYIPKFFKEIFNAGNKAMKHNKICVQYKISRVNHARHYCYFQCQIKCYLQLIPEHLSQNSST